MTDVTGVRKNVQEEEVDFRSPVSEATFTKLGGSLNFINNFQNKAFDFKFLGPFKTLTLPEDGSRSQLFDFEIVGISGMLFDRGDSGSTVVDIKYFVGGVDTGSVLSTPLTITSGAGVSQFFTEFVTPASSATAGVTLPVLSKTDFDAGDAIVVKLTSNAVSVENLTVSVHYRPR